MTLTPGESRLVEDGHSIGIYKGRCSLTVKSITGARARGALSSTPFPPLGKGHTDTHFNCHEPVVLQVSSWLYQTFNSLIAG